MVTATIDGQVHPLPDTESKITIVCKSPQLSMSEIAYEDDGQKALTLDFTAATYHADRVSTLDDETVALVQMVFPNFIWPLPRPWPDGVRHIVGLVDMTIKITKLQKGRILVAWKYPEAFLHPAEQANLADVVIKIHEKFKTNQ